LVFQPGDAIGSFAVVATHGTSDTVARYGVVGREGTRHAGRPGLLKVARHPPAVLRPGLMGALSRLLGRSAPLSLDPIGCETRALERCAHPAIAPVYEWGSRDGQPWVVTELVAGAGSGLDALARGDAREALAVMAATWS